MSTEERPREPPPLGQRERRLVLGQHLHADVVRARLVVGAHAGARLLPRVKGRVLRAAFVAVLVAVAAQMLREGLR